MENLTLQWKWFLKVSFVFFSTEDAGASRASSHKSSHMPAIGTECRDARGTRMTHLASLNTGFSRSWVVNGCVCHRRCWLPWFALHLGKLRARVLLTQCRFDCEIYIAQMMNLIKHTLHFRATLLPTDYLYRLYRVSTPNLHMTKLGQILTLHTLRVNLRS